MKVLSIIVTYNGMKWIDTCLQSLLKSEMGTDIFVVDNNSTDQTAAHIQANYRKVIFHQSTINLGFGKANNIGLQYAIAQNYEAVFLLNQDAWIATKTLSVLIQQLSTQSEFGIISPMHYNPHFNKFEYKFIEYVQEQNCPSLLEDIYFNTLKPIYFTSFVNAAAWLLPISTVKLVGGFDPLFPHYGEDVDYVQRCLKMNKKVGIVPLTYIYHDSNKQTWDQIKWNKNRMFTIYLSEVKNVTGSLRSNVLIFFKNRFDDITGHIIYGQFKLAWFRLKLSFKIIFSLRKISRARKQSKSEKAFL